MQTLKKRVDYYNTEEGQLIKLELEQMFADKLFNTSSSYSADSEAYPDHLIPFVDKHMNYLIVHPQLDARVYLSNLRLMTRLRTAK